MRRSEETGCAVNGVKGVSSLLGFKYVDVVQSLPVDDLHCCYIGVNSMMMDLWFDSVNHREKFYCGLKWSQIDKNLLAIAPPSNLSRAPRSITERKFWKGNEHRTWLFYYSMVCLQGILPQRYLLHYALLAEAVYILSQTNITPIAVERAEQNLIVFVQDFEKLYPVQKMVYNIHLLTHLVNSVKHSGPLWASSTFSFENNNGILVGFVHGTKDPMKQIFSKFSLSRYLVNDVNQSEVVESFAKKIYSKKKLC